MNGEAGLLDFRQRQLVFCALLVPHHHFRIVIPFVRRDDFHFNVSADRCESRTLQRGPTPNEPRPILQCPQWTFEPRRRHFQHVPPVDETRVRVEIRLNRARGSRTITDLYLFAIPPVNPDVEHRPRLAPADPEVHQIESDGVKFFLYNDLQTAIHVDSAFFRRQKNVGQLPPHPASVLGTAGPFNNTGRAEPRQAKSTLTAQVGTPDAITETWRPASPARCE